jgi:hypothetical protein
MRSGCLLIFLVWLHECFGVISTPRDLAIGSEAIEELCREMFVTMDVSRLTELCAIIRSHLEPDQASALFADTLFTWFTQSIAPLALQLYVGVSIEEFSEYDEHEKSGLRLRLLGMTSDLEVVCGWS